MTSRMPAGNRRLGSGGGVQLVFLQSPRDSVRHAAVAASVAEASNRKSNERNGRARHGGRGRS